MAVAHSAASESHTGATGSSNQASFSWTHTQTGTPQGVVVFVSTYASVANLITSVTYGGVALTRLAGGAALDGAGELGRCDAFFLGAGLGTGNQTITVNRTNNATVMYAAAATVTAGANTAVPTATIVLLQGDGTLAAQTVNDTSPGQNSVRYAGCYSGLNAPPTAGTGSTLLNSIDIGNYGSALVRETTAGQGARSIGFTGATDDRAAIHLAIRELVPRSLPQTVATFTFTGNNATLTFASPKDIAAELGTFTLTGNVANFAQQYKITIDAGDFALTGNDATLERNAVITAETGAFSFVGNAATLTVTAPKIIEAEVGTFVFNGNAASLSTNSRLEVAAGTFALAGNQAGLTKTVKLAADKGTFVFTGNAATLRHAYSLGAETGSFALSGQAATLRQNSRIQAETGLFTFTGNQASLKVGSKIAAETGSFALAGQTVTFRRTWAIDANTGAFVLTGEPAALTEIGAYEIDPFVGTFALAGGTVQLAQSRSLSVDAGTYSLTGQPAATTVGHAITGDLGKFFLPERNLRQYSEEFNNAYWTKGNSSITANSTAAPDGTLTADTLIENTVNSTHIILRNTSFTAGVKYTASLYVKTYLSRDVAIVLGTTAAFGGAGNTTVVFSPSTNTFLLAVNSPEAYGSEDVGDGWYRIYLTKTAVTTATTSSQIQLRIGTTGTYTGDGTSGAYVWGAQLEEGDLTAYDPTGPTSAPLTDLKTAHRLIAETGAFALTGNSATFAANRSVTAETGTFALSGNSATFAINRAVTAETGVFALTGNPATLVEQAARQLTADRGTFVLTGQQASLQNARIVSAEVGQFVLTGQAAELAKGKALAGQLGTFSLVGQNAILRVSRALGAENGVFIFTGNDAVLTKAGDVELIASAGTFALTGNAATLQRTRNRRRQVLIF